MEQHPVPQQISAYHFRLVGDMTIKQFVELAGGIVIGWLIYSLPLPSILRWPLVIFSVFTGVALAFLPLEERPLDRWLISFIKAVYSPTQYLWRKSPFIPEFFEELKAAQKKQIKEATVADRKRLEKYLETLPAPGPRTAIDTKELQSVSNIMNLYGQVQPKSITPVKPKQILLEEERAPKKVAVRKLKTPPLDPRAIMRGEIILPKRRTRSVKIPTLEPTEVEKQLHTPPPETPSPLQPESIEPPIPQYISPTGALKIPSAKQVAQAQTSSQLPMPTPPTEPNVIAGMAIDSQGGIVENAIVTIKDQEGNIARAQKTNKIGQFFIATPLENGVFEIEVEKEGLSFDIIKIKLEGKLVTPIEIKAKQ
jgi:hypothetical protein